MISTRFTALIIASMVASAAMTSATSEASLAGNLTSIPNRDIFSIYGCQGRGLTGECDNMIFTHNYCMSVPARQVNNMDSVRIPPNVVCNFFDTGDHSCIEATAVAYTTVIGPGTFDLTQLVAIVTMDSIA
ncbi:hypothetical protein C8R47DRAFT_1297928 [Mycena vitilis]|nr:hypothetical protein C8R47DRAFT_1297928 [Mycena vitilis]